jgi:hypothetical protein
MRATHLVQPYAQQTKSSIGVCGDHLKQFGELFADAINSLRVEEIAAVRECAFQTRAGLPQRQLQIMTRGCAVNINWLHG